MSYINAPIMEIFGGKKEIIAKFIIIRYHNGKFYFDKPTEISSDIIYKLIGLSKKGEPVFVGSNPEMVEKIISTPTGNNSKGLVIIQIKATTPKMVTKIVSTGLTITGCGCELNLDMLEFIDSIADKGKTYCWE